MSVTARSGSALPSKPQAVQRAFLAFTGVALLVYALLIPAVNVQYLPQDLRRQMLAARPVVAVALLMLCVAALAAVGTLDIRRWFGALMPAAYLALLMPVVFAAILIAKGTATVPTIVLYISWAGYSVIVAPALLHSPRQGRRAMVLLGGLTAVAVAALIFYSRLAPGAGGAEILQYHLSRESFGFVNPNYYGQVLQVVFLASSYVLAAGVQRRWVRYAWFGLGAAAAWLAVVAESRNVLIFMTVALGIFACWRYPRFRLSILGACLLGAILLSVAPRQTSITSGTGVDAFSSGRTALWSDVLAATRSGANDPFLTPFVGPTQLPDFEDPRQAYDPLSESRGYQRLRVDNGFLEMYVDVGLIGLLLFVAPYVIVWRRLWRAVRGHAGRVAQTGAWTAACLAGVAAQSTLVSTIPSLGNPVGAVMIILGLAVPTALIKSIEDADRRTTAPLAVSQTD